MGPPTLLAPHPGHNLRREMASLGIYFRIFKDTYFRIFRDIYFGIYRDIIYLARGRGMYMLTRRMTVFCHQTGGVGSVKTVVLYEGEEHLVLRKPYELQTATMLRFIMQYFSKIDNSTFFLLQELFNVR